MKSLSSSGRRVSALAAGIFDRIATKTQWALTKVGTLAFPLLEAKNTLNKVEGSDEGVNENKGATQSIGFSV